MSRPNISGIEMPILGGFKSEWNSVAWGSPTPAQYPHIQLSPLITKIKTFCGCLFGYARGFGRHTY